MEKLSYSITEVCEITGLGKTKIYQMIGKGILKAKKLGSRTIVLKEDLESFLSSLQSYNS